MHKNLFHHLVCVRVCVNTFFIIFFFTFLFLFCFCFEVSINSPWPTRLTDVFFVCCLQKKFIHTLTHTHICVYIFFCVFVIVVIPLVCVRRCNSMVQNLKAKDEVFEVLFSIKFYWRAKIKCSRQWLKS